MKTFKIKHVFDASEQFGDAQNSTLSKVAALTANPNPVNKESYAVAIQVFNHFYLPLALSSCKY